MVTGTFALARLREIRGTDSRAGVRLRTLWRFSWTGSVVKLRTLWRFSWTGAVVKLRTLWRFSWTGSVVKLRTLWRFSWTGAVVKLRTLWRFSWTGAVVKLRTLWRFSWTGLVTGVGVGLLMLPMAGGVRASTLIAQTTAALTGHSYSTDSLSDQVWLLQTLLLSDCAQLSVCVAACNSCAVVKVLALLWQAVTWRYLREMIRDLCRLNQE